jgi:hypothetical protein
MNKLPTDAKERKNIPIGTGVLDYFPDALAEVARVSLVGNKQHRPGEPLHWDKTKSTDEADALIRHFLERGTVDSDGVRHSGKLAWRALALLQREIEKDQHDKHTQSSANDNLPRSSDRSIVHAPTLLEPPEADDLERFNIEVANHFIGLGYACHTSYDFDTQETRVGIRKGNVGYSFVVRGKISRTADSERGTLQSGPPNRCVPQPTLWGASQSDQPRNKRQCHAPH